MPNDNEQRPNTPESFFDGERLYHSFVESLSLVKILERRYSSAVLHIPELRHSEVVKNSDFTELKSLGDQLNTIFYGQGPHRGQYDDIIDRAIISHTVENPGKYVALEDPDLATEAKGLVRAGMVYQLRQKQLEAARIARHNETVGSSTNGNRSEASKGARDTDELILFNHMVRDLIESDAGRKMNLDRKKVREIIKLIVAGDDETAESIEKGISLEVAAKHLLEKLIVTPTPEAAVIYGTLKDDKQAGDLILFPDNERAVMLDIKQTVPNNLRRHLSDEQLKSPGSFWVTNSRAYLWLGSGNQVGNNFSLPPEFIEVAEHLVAEAKPLSAVA